MGTAYMRGEINRLPLSVGRFALVSAGAAIVAVLAATFFAPPAQALPSFARQTGQPCGTCHTDFPGLTPYGRRFKLLGYTTGGGKYRTTPFPTFLTPDDSRAEADRLRSYAQGLEVGPGDPIATTYSDGSRPPVPIDRDQCGAGADGAVG